MNVSCFLSISAIMFYLILELGTALNRERFKI
jgi:hypothetical protein